MLAQNRRLTEANKNSKKYAPSSCPTWSVELWPKKKPMLLVRCLQLFAFSYSAGNHLTAQFNLIGFFFSRTKKK